MQNMMYFNSAMLQSYQYMQSLFFPQNNLGNIMVMPLFPTKVLSDQNLINVSSNSSQTTTPEKNQQFTLSIDSEGKNDMTAVKNQKLRKQFYSKTDEEQQFKVKIIKKTIGVSYKKKNTESNVVNQTFSYLSTDRSKNLISIFFKGDAQKTNQFYHLMTKIRQANKKYINRKYLKRLIEFQKGSQFFRIYSKAKIYCIAIQQIRNLLRILTFQFLRSHINTSLMTSSKIYKDTLFQHFWRKREVINFLFSHKQKHSL